MKKKWYLMPYNVNPGVTNMAMDLLLAREYSQFLDRPLLRFYGWLPDTISLGHSQSASDIDLHKVQSDGLAIVRRPTGGRAIYHAHELTYSVIYPQGEFKKEALYQQVNIWFKRLLDNLGVTSMVQNEQPDFKNHYQDMKSAPCFSAAAQYELKVQGKKIVGSAQRVFSTAILQHGSFMLEKDHLKLVDYLHKNETEKKSILNNLVAQATELNSHTHDFRSAQELSEMYVNILSDDSIVLEEYQIPDDLSSALSMVHEDILLAESELI